MERRKLLGLGALLSLVPFLPKMNILLEDGTVESFTPLIPPDPLSTIQETLDSLVRIDVTGMISMYTKKGKSIINGTGYIGDNFISWEIEVKENWGYGDEPKLRIPGLRYPLMKVISVKAEQQPEIPEFYIEGVEEPFVPHPNFLNFEMKYIITCQKL